MDARSIVDLKLQDSALREALRVISEATRAAGGRALLVGGCVRDSALGIPAKDLDIEIYGLLPDHLVAVLSARFAIDIVGQSFGVIKIRHLPIDVSIPHRDSKSGLGREGFGDNSDPWITPVETASRRDFTINAVALDPLDGEVIDPYGGLLDLRRRILRHSSMKFLEDPLRVLRGMQFVARFNLQAAPETVSLCRTVGPEGIARERIFEEWRKLVVLGLLPSLGLQFLRDCGWVRHFPELEVLIGCPQDPGWHPEGDVWTHTLHSMDTFAQERVQNEWEDLVVGLATLCHDFGKPATTELDGARVRSIGHERAGEMPTRSFLMRLANQRELVESVVPLVLSHLAPQ
jgi:tRNA nucleotidyltransferase (CCA-adding enzyme)